MGKNVKGMGSALIPPVPNRRWDPVRHCTSFESLASAKWRRNDLISDLERGNAEHHALAKRLLACRRASRCGSLACTICMRRYHRWIAAESLRFLQHRSRSTVLQVRATLSPFRCRFGCVDFDLPKIHAWLRDELLGSGFGDLIVLGGINLTPLAWDPLLRSEAWAVRLDLLMTGGERVVSKAAIRKVFERFCPSNEDDGPQVWVQKVDCDCDCTVRLYDPLYYVVADYENLHTHNDEELPVHLFEVPVHAGVHRDMAVFLDHWRFSNLLFLQRAELSGWRIKPTPRTHRL